MKWIDRLKAKIIHALGGLTRTEAVFPAPIAQALLTTSRRSGR